MKDDIEWIDDEAGPVVRPYALTGGRTKTSSTAFDLLSMAVATGSVIPANSQLGSEHRRLLETGETGTAGRGDRLGRRPAARSDQGVAGRSAGPGSHPGAVAASDGLGAR